jgi:SSS family solute:Na+ symporter
MKLPLVMLIAYMLITSVIGMAYTRKKQNSRQYFVAERSLSAVLVIALLFSEIIAGAGTIGNAASAFRGGLSSVWANWGMAMGCVAFAALVLTFYRAMGTVKDAMSVPEAFGNLFDGRCRIVMLLNVVVVYIILFSTQPVAAASILAPMLGIDHKVVAWTISAVFILITATGGMKGIAKMNVVHSVMMYVGVTVVAVKAVSSAGGLEALRAAVPETFFSVAQPNLQTVLGQALGTAISFFAASNVVSASFSAKSLKVARNGILLAGLLVVPFALMPAIIGVCASVAMPDIQANNALFYMADALGSGYGGLVSMAVMAAIWSTGPALLLIICTSLTKDLYKRYICPEATESRQIAFSRAAAVVIGIVATGFGLNVSSILNQMLGAFQIRSVVGIVLVAALFWPRVTGNAAFYSMLVGGIVAAAWHFLGNPLGLQPLWPAAAACLAILVPMTLAGQGRMSDGYRMYAECAAKLRETEERLEAVEVVGKLGEAEG